MTARTSTTPHRHFSQMTDRRDAPQPAPITAFPSAMGSFGDGTSALLLPLVCEMVIGFGTREGCEAVGPGAIDCAKVNVDDRGLVVSSSVGCEDDVDGCPRSFCPMFGRSRIVGMQYYVT